MTKILIEHFFSLAFAFNSGRMLDFFKKLLSPITKDFRRDHDYDIFTHQYSNHSLKDTLEEENNAIDFSFNRDSLTCLKVFLAGTEFYVGTELNWDQKFSDIEVCHSLHRFGWLLSAIAKNEISEEESISYVEDWIINNKDTRGIGWDSYSISERLVNWSLIHGRLILHLSDENPIKRSMKLQAEYLLQNLEIRGTSTNNHFFNNGRSLYITGLVLNEPKFKLVGEEIISLASKKILFSSGMTKEGSSHYQVLIARAFIEILWFSLNYEEGDIFLKYKQLSQKVLSAASFFLRTKPFPFIGDISPDFRLDFFEDLMKVGNLVINKNFTQLAKLNSSSWSYYFRNPKKEFYRQPSLQGEEKKEFPLLPHYKEAGFYFFQQQNFAVYIYLNPNCAVMPGTHAHSDIMSFILYFKGENILFDSGRFNYTNDDISRHGRGIRSHNSLSIDKREPQIIHGLNGYPELMDQRYLGKPSKISFQVDPLEITLVYKDYRFLKSPISLKRKLIFEDDILKVHDNLEGKGKHKIETFFHLNSNILQSKESKITAKFKHSNLEINVDCNDSVIHHIQGVNRNMSKTLSIKSENYGEFLETNSLIISQKKHFPVKNKFIFKFS